MWVEPEAFRPAPDSSRAGDVDHKANPHQYPDGSARATEEHTRSFRSPADEFRHPDRRNCRNQRKTFRGSPKHPHKFDRLLLRPSADDDNERRHEGEHEAGGIAATGGACCWESDAIIQAYRTAAAGTVRKLASALFGRELLAVEAAKTSAAERERMLEERAKTLFESQVRY